MRLFAQFAPNAELCVSCENATNILQYLREVHGLLANMRKTWPNSCKTYLFLSSATSAKNFRTVVILTHLCFNCDIIPNVDQMGNRMTGRPAYGLEEPLILPSALRMYRTASARTYARCLLLRGPALARASGRMLLACRRLAVELLPCIVPSPLLVGLRRSVAFARWRD